jgi:hypothetical protein
VSEELSQRDRIAAVVEHVDIAATGEEIGTAANAAIPQLQTSDPDEMADTIEAATSNVIAILEGLNAGADAGSLTAPGVSLDWAESLVHRAVDLSAVPWAYNFGQSRVQEALRGAVEQADVPAEQKWEIVNALSKYVNAYVEGVCAEMVDHFTQTRDRHYGDPGTMRREIVDAVLGGRLTDASTAAEGLGYRLDGSQIAVIVWADSADPDRAATTPVVDAAARLLTSLGATSMLVLPSAQSVVWAWGTGNGVRDGLDQQLSVGPGLYASVGAVGDGLAGFVRSHEDAAQARRMAGLLSRRAGSVVRYRSVALTSLIASEPTQAARFVADELGEIAGDTDQMRRLRATLVAFFDEGMRPVRTGRRLGIHQNTVLYRVKQAEQLLGHPIATRRLELEAALRLADAQTALGAFDPARRL